MSDTIMNSKTLSFKLPGSSLFDGPVASEKAKEKSRKVKVFEKISGLLSGIIETNEEVIALVPAVENVKIWEAVTTFCYAYKIKRVVLVFTDRRVIEVSVNSKADTVNRVRILRYSSIKDIKCVGNIFRHVEIKFRDNSIAVYENIAKPDFKDIAGRLSNRILSAPRSIQNGIVKSAYHICPSCFSMLKQNVYSCPSCTKKFKKEKNLGFLSFIIPGGSYLAFGFYQAAVISFLVELLFIAGTAYFIYEAFQKNMEYIFFALFYAVLFSLSKVFSYLFCRKQVRSFIAEKNDSSNAK